MTEQTQEQEINLQDYINVLLNRKRLIAGVFLLITIPFVVFIFLQPSVYEAVMIIEPSSASVSSSGSPVYIDTPQNIRIKIQEKIYNARVLKKLNVDSKKFPLQFKATQPENSSMIKVTLDVNQGYETTGLNALRQLFSELSASYEDTINYKKKMADDRIKDISNILENENYSLSSVRENIKILDEREKKIISEFSEQEAIRPKQYDISLGNQLDVIKLERKRLLNELDNLNKAAASYRKELNMLFIDKENMKNVVMIQEPAISEHPIRPKKKQGVIVTVFVALCMAVITAFFAEFLNLKKR